MSPDHVIESYVRDVARNLPGKIRHEIAADLRAQLGDELMGRAEAAGRAPDEALATALVRDFGRPEELAARYHPPFAIIEPADTRRFIVVSVIGYGILATLVVTLARLGVGAAETYDTNNFLGWVGLMTVLFGLRNWLRRRNPEKYAWKPHKVLDLAKVNYLDLIVAVPATLFFLATYIWPGPVVEFLTGGQIPAGMMAYQPDFADPTRLRSPWLAIWLLAIVGLHLWVAVRGRWTRLTRWLYIFFLFHVAFQLGWHMAYGPVFLNPEVERVVFLAASLLILGIGIDLWLRVLREWDWIEPPQGAPLAAT